MKHTDQPVNYTHRTWSGKPGRATRLHNPTPTITWNNVSRCQFPWPVCSSTFRAAMNAEL
jgi:hypothetical protein